MATNDSPPLDAELYQKLKDLGVGSFELRFRGGNDEGFLDVFVHDTQGTLIAEDSEVWIGGGSHSHEAIDLIAEWADEAIAYSGAGDGNDYGDNYTYDLVNDVVKHDEWYQATTSDLGDPHPLATVMHGTIEERTPNYEAFLAKDFLLNYFEPEMAEDFLVQLKAAGLFIAATP